jgi:hypothetical protein
MTNALRRSTAAAAATALAVALVGTVALPAQAADDLTNTAHLDFLLDTATPTAVPGHTTYNLETEPELTLPWTYADARDGGTFERIGGGPLDPATGDYAQGAYNADDVSRTAVVYLRHWQQTGSEASRDKAYEVLRSLAYLQTDSGPDAGNVVLWMQTDGELNPSAEPVELPDPSDSADSYWLARTLWAFGEGYAAFRDSDPEFAAFLQQRLQLGIAAVDREVLVRYGEYDVADGVEVPGWLIADGADATAEALIGLSAYLEAAPDDAGVRSSTAQLAEGVAALARTTSEGDTTEWPYGAALPWALSRSMWHAWSSQMPTALVVSAEALGDSSLAEPAVVEGTRFAPLLLASGGPANGWYPSPTETVQIAYGADSRLQASLALADATGSELFTDLAGLQGAWFFGLNPAGEPMYDPATGVTYDGIGADGAINRNSGAESTIHGLLAALALDAHPEVAARATAVTDEVQRVGIEFVQAEAAVTGGSVETPASSWTGESSWNGDYVRIPAGSSASVALGSWPLDRIVEPVAWSVPEGEAVPTSTWTTRGRSLGAIDHVVGAQGVTESAGALVAQRIGALPARASTVSVAVSGADLLLDGFLVRSSVVGLMAGGSGSTVMLHNSGDRAQSATIPTGEWKGASARIYDGSGALVDERTLSGRERLTLEPGWTAVATR